MIAVQLTYLSSKLKKRGGDHVEIPKTFPGKGKLPFILHEIYSPHLEVCSIGPKHIAVKRFAHFIYGRFPPASGVITKRTVLTGRERG